ncbi:MAG: aminotransferase class V-fold PLP-dependent enzyme, partial [Candidatus Omnitrophica bacterium]|nr:aminotransferase class V-fold PLP-dependent enzyme [Candidatus Omnitrophota bacterium]
RIIEDITKNIPGVKINGSLDQRLPNNIHLSIEGCQGEALLMSLDMHGICASMGSACTSGSMEPSSVLRAIGVADDIILNSIRISLGRFTTQEDVDVLLEKLPKLVEQLRI